MNTILGDTTLKVLLIDDDPLSLSSLETALSLMEVDCESFQDPLSGIDSYRTGGFDAVISDIRMPSMSGLEVMKTVHGMNPAAKVILISGSCSGQSKVTGNEDQVYAFFPKPIHISGLITALREIERENKKQLN